MKSFVVLCIVGIMYSTVREQKVEGYISDAQSNEPLMEVNVTYQLKEGTEGGTSDINGFYEIVVPAGGIELAFSFVGYESQLLPLVANLRQGLKKDVYLKMAAHLLEDVVISAGRFEQK